VGIQYVKMHRREARCRAEYAMLWSVSIKCSAAAAQGTASADVRAAPAEDWKVRKTEHGSLLITGIAGCCARAASGHAAAAPPSSVMNVRRFTAPCLPCFGPKG